VSLKSIRWGFCGECGKEVPIIADKKGEMLERHRPYGTVADSGSPLGTQYCVGSLEEPQSAPESVEGHAFSDEKRELPRERAEPFLTATEALQRHAERIEELSARTREQMRATREARQIRDAYREARRAREETPPLEAPQAREWIRGASADYLIPGESAETTSEFLRRWSDTIQRTAAEQRATLPDALRRATEAIGAPEAMQGMQRHWANAVREAQHYVRYLTGDPSLTVVMDGQPIEGVVSFEIHSEPTTSREALEALGFRLEAGSPPIELEQVVAPIQMLPLTQLGEALSSGEWRATQGELSADVTAIVDMFGLTVSAGRVLHFNDEG
jgi:hypothetical protein